MVQKCTF